MLGAEPSGVAQIDRRAAARRSIEWRRPPHRRTVIGCTVDDFDFDAILTLTDTDTDTAAPLHYHKKDTKGRTRSYSNYHKKDTKGRTRSYSNKDEVITLSHYPKVSAKTRTNIAPDTRAPRECHHEGKEERKTKN